MTVAKRVEQIARKVLGADAGIMTDALSWTGTFHGVAARLLREYAERIGSNARMRQMAEVTYYVALPFVPSDDGIAPGEAIECFNPNAAVMKAVAQTRPCRRRRVQPQRGS